MISESEIKRLLALPLEKRKIKIVASDGELANIAISIDSFFKRRFPKRIGLLHSRCGSSFYISSENPEYGREPIYYVYRKHIEVLPQQIQLNLFGDEYDKI